MENSDNQDQAVPQDDYQKALEAMEQEDSREERAGTMVADFQLGVDYVTSANQPDLIDFGDSEPQDSKQIVDVDLSSTVVEDVQGQH